mmetsp:Transcript_31929/g.83543  ORF Transcript_31929/g.83543 Transcript_31929/m.83543 type:complete len:201 (+) Transcript_31929:328-930(+)
MHFHQRARRPLRLPFFFWRRELRESSSSSSDSLAPMPSSSSSSSTLLAPHSSSSSSSSVASKWWLPFRRELDDLCARDDGRRNILPLCSCRCLNRRSRAMGMAPKTRNVPIMSAILKKSPPSSTGVLLKSPFESGKSPSCTYLLNVCFAVDRAEFILWRAIIVGTPVNGGQGGGGLGDGGGGGGGGSGSGEGGGGGAWGS